MPQKAFLMKNNIFTVIEVNKFITLSYVKYSKTICSFQNANIMTIENALSTKKCQCPKFIL